MQFAFDLIEPFYYQQSSAEPPSNLFVTGPLLLILMTALTFYLIDWKKRDETSRRNFCLLLVFVKLPVVAALAARGVEHEYLLFEGEGHELLSTPNRVAFVRATVGWLTRHLRVEAAVSQVS